MCPAQSDHDINTNQRIVNPLLKRQIQKLLPEEFHADPKLAAFLNAVDSSYHTHDEQFSMLQRATQISSEELSAVNKKLQAESTAQLRIIESVHLLMDSLQLTSPESKGELKVVDLAHYIQQQSKKMSLISQEQKELLKNLEQKNEVLSEYAQMVSHDLKSPLRSIHSLVHFIMEDCGDKLQGQNKVNMDLILKNLEKMDALISGILNYSTIDQSKPIRKKVDLNILMEEVLSIIFVPEHCRITIADKLPVVKGDPIRLQQLFQNLLQNAIKSIDKPIGEIRLEVTKNGKYWQFAIQDNGIGIPEHLHEKIFKLFEKIEHDEVSTGIGLSIVKKIIDLYGGEIWLESTVSEGSTFYFTIPQ